MGCYACGISLDTSRQCSVMRPAHYITEEEDSWKGKVDDNLITFLETENKFTAFCSKQTLHFLVQSGKKIFILYIFFMHYGLQFIM